MLEKNYSILIGANGTEFKAAINTTEEKMREFIWEVINTGWMRKDSTKYFFLPAHCIAYVEVEEVV